MNQEYMNYYGGPFVLSQSKQSIIMWMVEKMY